jgi:hypothetical protein
MYVVKVTPEGIALRGKSDIGSSNGFFDRRTGHGIITEFNRAPDCLSSSAFSRPSQRLAGSASDVLYFDGIQARG